MERRREVIMKQAIHLIDPVNGYKLGSRFPIMRCGRTQNINSVKPEYTTQPAEVTCTNCRSYINNPWRILRKYGKVKVVESFYALLWSDYGYPFDVVATADTPGNWIVTISRKTEIHDVRRLEATNMADLGFKLVSIVENEISKDRLTQNA